MPYASGMLSVSELHNPVLEFKPHLLPAYTQESDLLNDLGFHICIARMIRAIYAIELRVLDYHVQRV